MSDKLGLVGRKIGMTRIFEEDGRSVPVTVLDVSGNRVTRVKTVETDGYNAIQVAFGTKKPSRVNKAAAGEFAKAGVDAERGLLLVRGAVPGAKGGEVVVRAAVKA